MKDSVMRFDTRLIMLIGCAVVGLVSGGLLINYLLMVRVLPTYKMVLLTRNASFAQQITEGVNEEIARHPEIKFEIRSFYAPGRDQLSMQSMAEEAISTKPDLILSFGVAFTQIAVTILSKRHENIPFIFAGSGDPVTQGLVSAMDRRLEQVTGVLVDRIDYTQPVNLLLQSKPSVKNVLIPYFPMALGGMIEQAAVDVQRLFNQRGVTVYLVPLDIRSNVQAMLTPFMNKVDTVMCLEGDRLDDYNAGLIKLCTEHHVTLYAKEIESVRDGAALGFGTYAKEVGVMMMRYAYKILKKEATAAELPVYTLDGSRILVLNKTAALQQDLPVTDDLLRLVDRVYP